MTQHPPWPHASLGAGVRRLAAVVLLSALPSVALAGEAVVPEGCAEPISDSYLVMLDTEGARTSLSSRASQLALTYQGTVERVFEHAFEGFETKMSAFQADLLADEVDVVTVEQNCRGWALSTFGSSGTQFNAPWALDRTDQRNLPLDTTYNYPGTGQGIHIYILDSGIRAGLAEFTGRVGNGFTAIGGSLLDSCNGHGTAVASAAAGTVHGVAKGATLHPVVILGCCSNCTSNADAIAGIDWVIQNHQAPAVINMSVHYGFSIPLRDAIPAAIDAGITFVTGAGNASSCASSALPSREWEVITAAASDELDQFAGFSNYGNRVDLIAPGVDVLVSCPAALALCSSGCVPAGGNTSRCDGTSLSGPIVAGVAALHLEQNPSASPADVESALVSSASVGKISAIPTSPPPPASQCGPTANRLVYSGYLDNEPPVAVDDYLLTTWETPLLLIEGDLLANDKDTEHDPLSIVGYGTPIHGSLTPTPGGVTYAPPSGCEVSQDSFTYTLSDGLDQTTGTVNITIGGIVCPASS